MKNNKKYNPIADNDSRSKTKKEKEWLVVSIAIAVLVICMVYVVSIQEVGSRLYYKGNNAIFIICIMIFSAFIATKKNFKTQFSHFLEMVRFKKGMSLSDMADGVIIIIYIICILSFLFILDISFISHYGIRISSVVGVLLLRLIKVSIFDKC